MPIEIRALMKFQKIVNLRCFLIDGNHRSVHVLVHFFGFRIDDTDESKILILESSSGPRFAEVKSFYFNYNWLFKPYTMDSVQYLEKCREESETIQNQYVLAIPIEKSQG